MIIYALEYKRHGWKVWTDFDEFTQLNEAVNRAEYEGRKDHMQNVDFRIIKRTIIEEEMKLWKSKKTGA
jgi:hypothetical protein